MSKISDIFSSGIRDWYWLFEAGKPQRKTNISILRNNNFEDLPAPVFFLSTGRTGTQWFSYLFKKQKNLMVFHQAVPSLAIQNKFYYNILKNDNLDDNLKFEIGKEIFLAAREEYFVYSYKTNKIFLETNNDLLFFAELISKLIPNSKFVHLYRHPGDFVRSGLARAWFNDKLVDQKMIVPNSIENWDKLSRVQKISWLWLEENSFIENIKLKIGKDRFFNFNFSTFSSKELIDLSIFVGSELSKKKIEKTKEVRLNIQKNNFIPKYEKWEEKDKNDLREICGDLAEKYGYKL